MWQPSCSVEQNHLRNVCKGHYGEQFCEILFNLGQWLRKKMSLKEISYLELWQPHCSVEQNQLCNFIEDIIRNKSLKIF